MAYYGGTRQDDSDPSWRWIICLAAGLCLFIYSIVGGINEIRFATSGKETTATITNSWNYSGKNGSSNTTYDYEFKVDGKTYSDSRGSFADGNQFQIEYLPSNPDDHRLKGHSKALFDIVTLIIGVVLLILGVVLFNSNDTLQDD